MIDLHCHSTISDGMLAPADLVRLAHAQGVRLLALTDHDDLGGLADAAATAQQLGMQFVHGVEISVLWQERTVHIVGLRIDPTDAALVQGLAELRAGRLLRAQKIADELSKVGIADSLQGAYRYSTGNIISRAHFARYLVEQGYAKDVGAVFKRYLVKGKPGYVQHQWATLATALQWIHQAGGVAVMAHPGRYDMGKQMLHQLIQEFIQLGGKGIEVVTGSHRPEQFRTFADIAQKYQLLSSMGSDYHGKGMSFVGMGQLPGLPGHCVPVWHDWPEFAQLQLQQQQEQQLQ